ncbi:TonB-dependent receptor plug domain-containing protein [Nitratiruptor sp. SB155-2]|uniref:TonB-dependent receptor plug domain-containing protein n=1 Tax=Nitratiruptor sp. (strain SB155-2) TaxID=387092 RepID=UPI0001586D49|nr:TonB-dependent receptor [Nitratiruptor sp. SB155-2]BAF69667.1 TonB-dependent receptor [Nitratiruptor sp. SB155-2]
MARGFKRRYFSLAAIAATVSVFTLNAQAARVESIEKIVVSANKDTQALEDVTDDVTIITEQDIEELGVQTLPELLKEIQGLDIVQTGGFGQPASLYLQGLNPDKTLILIDGIRFNDPTGLNGGQLELIDLSQIQRVEIIRGPQSGVWGADAMGGVINIVTKSAQKGTHGGWSMEGGSYSTYHGNINLFKGFEKGYFGVALSKYQTQGFSAYSAKRGEPLYGVKVSDLPLEDDGYENRKIQLKTGWEIYGAKLFANFIKIDATVHYDGFGYDAPDSPYTVNVINDTLFQAGLEKSVESHALKLQYSYSGFKRSQYGGYEGSVRELEFKDRVVINSLITQFGGGWQRFYQKKSAGTPTNDGCQNRYLFITNTLQSNKLLINVDARYDSYNRFDDKLTYKVGIKYPIVKDIYVGANGATGYKAPSIFQLNYNATSNLNPEKSFGYNFFIGNDMIKFTYFHNAIKDLISYTDPDGDYRTPNDYYYNAPGKSTFKGYTVAFSKDFFEKFYLNLNYTYLDAKDAFGNDLPRRAKEKIGYSLSWYPTDKHTVNINGYYVGKREDVDGTNIGKYNVTNLSLQHNFAKHMTGFIKINNIFDRFYQEVHGYATADRSYYIGIRASY